MSSDVIHSFEERSSTDIRNELGSSPTNRVIIIDRHDPKITNSIDTIKSDVDFGPFPSNQWKTSKYTIFNFLFKNLFEQFRRLANLYFLISGIIQTLLPFSPIGPTTSLLPLIFVISTTALKQAYEDYLRHKMDNEINNRVYHVLRHKKLTRVKSKDIRVGDFVYIKNNEEIPCDMILLAASGSSDRCYITTSNLDGEMSLKSRSCFNIRAQLGSIEKLDDTLLVVECDQPNATLYEFNGNLRAPKDPQAYSRLMSDLIPNQSTKFKSVRAKNSVSNESSKSILYSIYRRIKRKKLGFQMKKSIKLPIEGIMETSSDDYHEIVLDISNLLLRASRLKNTAHVFGLAVYTGIDTKLAHNSQVKPNKFSSIESRVNAFLCIAFVILISATLFGALNNLALRSKSDYSIDGDESFGRTLLSHFLLYNYMAPISLYVTLEFVKFLGASAVVNDKNMSAIVWKSVLDSTSSKLIINNPSVKEHTKTSHKDGSYKTVNYSLSIGEAKHEKVKTVENAKCNSSDLNEDLGQVEVLFSDKTGTLTENKMQFIACSAHGKLYRSVSNHLYQELTNITVNPIVRKVAKVTSNRYEYISPSTSVSHGSGSHKSKGKQFDHKIIPHADKMKLVTDLRSHEDIVDFFVCLCLCSTISINENLSLAECLTDKMITESDYQSASPDEESLISAASSFGIRLIKSSERDCYLAIDRKRNSPASLVSDRNQGHFKLLAETKDSTDTFVVRHFKRLTSFDFTSVRKRMSVIYLDCDNDCIVLVAKGSENLLDCISMHQLDPESERDIDVTMAHFETFAKCGLRTMLVARKIINKKDFDRLMSDVKEARLAVQDRNQLINSVYRRAESDLKLIGATGVEDSLQVGVPETISRLKSAGIKIWLLTGDKVETATSVASLCKLLDSEMTIFHLVRQQDAKSCIEVLNAFLTQLNHLRRKELDGVSTKKSLSSLRSKSSSHRDEHHVRFALVLDGRSLYFALKYCKEEFGAICKECTCVLGCRLSPLQKAEIVSMVKRSPDGPITAAIGDGANDVSMIQESHVGIGIIGKEGRQAVNSSDFAINKFYMLNRLLFVHGHLFYHRTANLIHYFFYKALIFILPQFMYSIYSLSKPISLYDPIMLICFNLVFTSLPILIYGLYEVHIPKSTLERYPSLYRINKRNCQLKYTVFASWLLLALVQSMVAFFWTHLSLKFQDPLKDSKDKTGMGPTNEPEQKFAFALMLYFSLVFICTIKLCILAQSHSMLFNVSALASCISLPLIFYIYSLFEWSGAAKFHANFLYNMRSLTFWIAVVSTTGIAMFVDVCFHFVGRLMNLRELRSLAVIESQA